MTADQLMLEQSAGNVFHGFREGAISFAPTYKYDLFSDDYDTSEKCRVPAYTDRILFTRRKPAGPLARDWRDGDIVSYTRAELKVSDHRPVLAVFQVQAREVDTDMRARVVRDTVIGAIVASPERDMVSHPEVKSIGVVTSSASAHQCPSLEVGPLAQSQHLVASLLDDLDSSDIWADF